MSPLAPFGARLTDAIAQHGPLCVGIDPHPGLLDAWRLPSSVEGLRTFALRCVEAFAGHVAVVKPQAAFFESYGSAGIAVLERVIAGFRDSGTLVLVDAKRGDIGSTVDAYARAFLADGAPLAGDAVTLSPYLGFGSLEPAVRLAGETGRGVFVLAATSNPEGPTVQRALLAHTVPAERSRTVAQAVVDFFADDHTKGTLERLQASGVQPQDAEAAPQGGVLMGQTVVLTGTLPTLGRKEAQALIEQHGGSVDLIDAEPDANGRIGACFTFTLPLDSGETTDETASVQEASVKDTTQGGPDATEGQGQGEPPVMAVEKT